MSGSFEASSRSGVSSVKNKPKWISNCACGDPIKYSTAKSDDNPGRRYKACPNYKDKFNKGCGYFRWIDKQVPKVGSGKDDSLVKVEKLGKSVLFWQKLVFLMMVIIACMIAYGFGMFGKKYLYLALP